MGDIGRPIKREVWEPTDEPVPTPAPPMPVPDPEPVPVPVPAGREEER